MKCGKFAFQRIFTCMVLVFDLDDTLYDERTYVRSGFRAVARWLNTIFGWKKDTTYDFMTEVLETEGRGRVFDRLLEQQGSLTKTLVQDCLRVYRHHRPKIQLWPDARAFLKQYCGDALYLVTDGHKVVQAQKVHALGINGRFRKVYLTHRYSIRSAKPSTRCFELIRARENCDWKEMIHIGDNPAKDFVGLKALGVRTVRVLTGCHRNTPAQPGYDAEYRIQDLAHLPSLLRRMQI